MPTIGRLNMIGLGVGLGLGQGTAVVIFVSYTKYPQPLCRRTGKPTAVAHKITPDSNNSEHNSLSEHGSAALFSQTLGMIDLVLLLSIDTATYIGSTITRVPHFHYRSEVSLPNGSAPHSSVDLTWARTFCWRRVAIDPMVVHIATSGSTKSKTANTLVTHSVVWLVGDALSLIHI